MPTRVDQTTRTLRRAMGVTAVLLAVVLVGTSLVSWGTAMRVQQALTVGQAESFLGTLRQLHAGRAPQTADFEQLLELQGAEGLRWAGLVTPGGEVLVEAGRRSEGALVGLRPGPPQRVDGRVRMVLPPPRPMRDPSGRPPPEGPRPPGPEDAPGPPGAPPAPAGQMPLTVLEFEPTLAFTLLRSASLSLGVTVLAALAMVLSAAVFARMWARADEAEAALARSQHMATLGEMSAVLAHEIRNPLAALKGHAQLLGEALSPDDPQAGRVTRILNTTARLEQLTEDLLDFVRAGEIHRRDVDPGALVTEAVAEALPGAMVDLSGAPSTWMLDGSRVRQAVDNLLRNAAEASPEGVRVTVDSREGSLQIVVEDRGPGLPDGPVEQLFEPFQTHRTRGVGLGLAVVRRVAEQHGGSALAERREGGGARFRIVLPPAHEEV